MRRSVQNQQPGQGDQGFSNRAHGGFLPHCEVEPLSELQRPRYGCRMGTASGKLHNADPVDPCANLTSACSPSPTARRNTPARSFQRTWSPARQAGAIRVTTGAARRAFRWLALRGSPAGNRCLPDKLHPPELAASYNAMSGLVPRRPLRYTGLGPDDSISPN